MRTPYSISGILVLLLVLTGCQTQVIQPDVIDAEIIEIEYQTYGGFTMAETNLQITKINSKEITYFLGAYNKSETFSTSVLNNQTFEELVELLMKNNFKNWEYNQTSDINIADVGVAEIVVTYSDNTSQVVKFDPYVPNEYGTDKEEVLNNLSSITNDFFEEYLKTTSNEDNTKTITFQPMQCEQTPWQEWYENGSAQFLVEPTDEELILAYYGEQGIEIANVEKVESEEMVCQACSVCATSYYFTAEVESGTKIKGWN